MRKSIQKGFTLIELMIVVAIIGILAAIAIPAYQDYTIRAQVTEGLSLAGGVQTAIADYYAQHGTFPSAGVTTTGTGGLAMAAAPTGKYATVNTVDATGGIQITFSGAQANATLAANPKLALNAATTANGDIVWVCGSAATPSGATVSGTATTNVLAKYLPATCKA